MFASVIVDIKNKEINRQFDYIIKDEDVLSIKRGMRVVVPFGEQLRMGYVISIFDKSEKANKEIVDILDVQPTVDEETFKIIDDIYEKTHQIYAAIFETVVPSQIQLKYKKQITLLNPDLVDASFKQLFNHKNMLTISKNNHEYDYKLRKYNAMNAIEIKQIYEQKTKEKYETKYQFNKNHQYQRASIYEDVLILLKDQIHSKDELIDLGLSISSIKTLVKHGVLSKLEVKIKRDVSHVFKLNDKKISLTKDQSKIFEHIKIGLNHHEKHLIKGVTGSGKTEIYLNLIEEVLKQHKQVMILVPEITLIAPMAQRLKSKFDDVEIYHSALSSGERLDAYIAIKEGESRILLGTRSASFLPFKALGLIIIDESHDDSYIQNESVIYDAIDVLELRALIKDISIVLGSATPKVTRYYQAKNQVYQLHELNQRPNGIKLPHIELVDMKDELKASNTSMFSRKLEQAILDRLSKKEQVMILFNRKGYAPFVMCRTCGHVPTCPTCGIALTYYKDDQKLKCHYCGHEEMYKDHCSVCQSTQIKEVGVGIEQVEKALKKAFSQARILRMDANVAKTKGSHEMIWHQFNEADADILLGTQMIAKGLDFPKVTLVGVLMADLMLRIPSYLASEKAYTLLTQISGRSGRFTQGDVIIQGYDLNHYAIKHAKDAYETFYQSALYDRKIANYEPFMHIAQLLVEGKSYLKTYQNAFRLKKHIEQINTYSVLGPTPAYIKKIGDDYRFVMTLKYKIFDSKIFEYIDQVESKETRIKYYPNQELV